MERLTSEPCKELMVINNDLIVTSILNPFDPYNSQYTRCFPVGLTVQECVDAVIDLRPGYEYVVSINGSVLDPSLDLTKYRPIGHLAVCAVPQGGGGGGKNILRTVAMIALMVAVSVVSAGVGGMILAGGELAAGGLAAGFTSGMALGIGGVASLSIGAALGGIAAGMLVGYLGSQLINALLPVQTPDMAGVSDFSESPTYSWQASQNSNREGVVFPVLYGTHRILPPIISKYIEVVSDKQYYNLLYAIADHAITSIDDTSLRLNENSVYQGEEGLSWETRLGAVNQAVLQFFGDTRSAKMEGHKITTAWTTSSTARITRITCNSSRTQAGNIWEKWEAGNTSAQKQKELPSPRSTPIKIPRHRSISG